MFLSKFLKRAPSALPISSEIRLQRYSSCCTCTICFETVAAYANYAAGFPVLFLADHVPDKYVLAVFPDFQANSVTVQTHGPVW